VASERDRGFTVEEEAEMDRLWAETAAPMTNKPEWA